MSDGLKILDVRWFNGGRGSVGIVCVETIDEEDESPEPRRVVRYFIGPIAGHNEPQDVRDVADWGARFPEAVGALLFGRRT